jgi:DNA-binding CsgD family transcriptional regulator
VTKADPPERGVRKLKELDASDIAAIESLPADDPARALIANILKVVPVSHWSFARFKGHGDGNALLTSVENHADREAEFRRMRAEFVLQRNVTAHGPRMASTIAPLAAPYSSGLTMLFADRHHDLGILTLLRTDTAGSFTSVEIRALALALDASADLLMPLPFADVPSRAGAKKVSPELVSPEMLVLDTDLNIVFTWSEGEKRRAEIARSRAVMENRLPMILEETVRELTSSWISEAAAPHGGVAAPLPFLVVRTQPLQGPTGLFIGVLLDRVPTKRPVLRAAEQFAFSPREVQTLALLLDGATLDDITDRMNITSSTVQDHIRSLVSKTGARNRSEMIAKVLGWEQGG